MTVEQAALIVTAAATAVLAFLTWRLVRANNKLVGENAKLIAAAEKEASASLATVEEIRRDREIGYRPFMDWKFTEFRRNRVPTKQWLHRYPEGRELWSWPSDQRRLLHAVREDAARTPTFSLSPNEEGEVKSYGQAETRPPDDFLGYQNDKGQWEAIFCEDQLGNTFRFTLERARPKFGQLRRQNHQAAGSNGIDSRRSEPLVD